MALPSQVPPNELPLSASFTTIFLCVLFGANATAIKISLLGLGVFTTASLRFSIASLILFFLARRRRKSLTLSKLQIVQVLLISFIFFMQMAGYYYGQNITTAAHGTLIANLLPFIVMVLAHYLLPNDKMNSRKALGLILGFIGVLLLFFDKAMIDPATIQADFIILCAVFLWGINVILIKRIIAGFDAIQLTFCMILFSLPFYYSAALLWDKQMIRFVSPEILLALLYQSIVTASFGYALWNTMMQKYGATALHSFVFIIPLSGVFFGVLLLDETVTSRLAASVCLVTIGLIVVNFKTKKPPLPLFKTICFQQYFTEPESQAETAPFEPEFL